MGWGACPWPQKDQIDQGANQDGRRHAEEGVQNEQQGHSILIAAALNQAQFSRHVFAFEPRH